MCKLKALIWSYISCLQKYTPLLCQAIETTWSILDHFSIHRQTRKSRFRFPSPLILTVCIEAEPFRHELAGEWLRTYRRHLQPGVSALRNIRHGVHINPDRLEQRWWRIRKPGRLAIACKIFVLCRGEWRIYRMYGGRVGVVVI